MSNNVLIVATDPAAKAPAEVATELSFTPVVAGSEQEALALLDRENFALIAVSGGSSPLLRAEAERKQPMARLLELPESHGEELRTLMVRYLDRRAPRHFAAEERYRFLSTILESFTTTLELKEVLRRMVTITREEFAADRAWLLQPINETAEFASVRFSVSAPHLQNELGDAGPISLVNSRGLIRRAMESSLPVVIHAGDADLDPELCARYGVQSEMVQILRPREEEPWAFGMHQCTAREWTAEEIELFGEIGRYATLALNNTLLHARAVREMAKVNAILDQIPESAGIYDANGRLERMNAAATREPSQLFTPEPEERARSNRHRYIDGSPLSPSELPSMRALRGETVKSDYLVHDGRTDDDRVVNLKAAPIRDDHGRIIGSVVLSRDVTEERQNAERESWRRRRAECLANLGLEAVTMQPTFDDLNETAMRVAQAVVGSVKIHLYHSAAGHLEMVGWGSTEPSVDRFRDYFAT
ncbi:MAG TPA: PAS domain-containing protein, partial [Thermoanaerobaculia bacterium]|nr:PAS domain-containing protein [Thermoanaerobaculia bacterium]